MTTTNSKRSDELNSLKNINFDHNNETTTFSKETTPDVIPFTNEELFRTLIITKHSFLQIILFFAGGEVAMTITIEGLEEPSESRSQVSKNSLQLNRFTEPSIPDGQISIRNQYSIDSYPLPEKHTAIYIFEQAYHNFYLLISM